MNVKPEVNVALWARLYRVLADRNEYMREDPGERIDRTAPNVASCLSEVDAELAGRATELDRLCGYAVRLLRKNVAAPVIDLLGIVRDDRLAAIAYALPEDRRRAIVRRDPVWARAVAAFDPETMADVEDLAAELDALAKDTDAEIRRCLGVEFAADVIEFGQELRRLDAGIANKLTLGDLLLAIDAKDDLAALVERARREHLTVAE